MKFSVCTGPHIIKEYFVVVGISRSHLDLILPHNDNFCCLGSNDVELK